MADQPPAYALPDFRALDFERLWLGRRKTTDLESWVLARCFGASLSDRLLEVGPGGGRLTPLLRGRATEFVAVDVTRAFLDRLLREGATLPAFVRRSWSTLDKLKSGPPLRALETFG